MAETPLPHVVIFPFPAQGHINSMLKLAELLALAGIRITFLNTKYNNDSLLQRSDAKTRFAELPNLRFKPIDDGVLLGHPPTIDYLENFLKVLNTVVRQDLKDLLSSGGLESDGWPPVTCVVSDGLMTFPIDVAIELGIPSISFRTESACFFWICFCIPKLVESGQIPFGEDADMDELVTSLPGMEGLVRRRDLPSFFKTKVINDDVLIQRLSMETHNSARANAHILNTFEDLEGLTLTHIRTHISKVYTLGPLHALLNLRRKELSLSSFSNSLLEADKSCIAWLDCQPLKSVIYVSFGSVIFMNHKEILEFWHGLVNSGTRFLWVIRKDIVKDKDDGKEIPKELHEGTKERGCIVSWSPQEEVLAHPAVGGFLTHSGWNSTMESFEAGVPMVCFPQMGDQQINCRFVSEQWKVGLDMNRMCDRSTVEMMVRDVMEDKRVIIMESMDEMADKARRSINKGGSSYSNMEKLIQDIKSMNL